LSDWVKGFQLLPKEHRIKTSEIDCPSWTESGFVGVVLRQRFRLLGKLLSGKHFPRLLDVGYGSGMIMPELARHCDDLLGIDVHPCGGGVMKELAQEGLTAGLVQASGAGLPFATASIDGIVAMSSLEFVRPFESAAREMKRVLRPGGMLMVITPGHSSVLDFGLRALTGRSAKEDFGDRRRHIVPTLKNEFAVDAHLRFPPLGVHLYDAYRFRKD
jgi:SAM-dependent methyltransferase